MDQRDEDLVVQLATNLDYYFEQLVTRYQGPLDRQALGLVKNPEDAQDIVQEVFLHAYRDLESRSPQDIQTLKIGPWLHTINRNTCLNHIRKKSKTREVPLDTLDTSEASVLSKITDEDPNQQPEKVLESAEGTREVEGSLKQLSESYRAAVIPHLKGHTYNEIATMLNQPIGTVKSHVSRGKKWLRSRLRLGST